MVILTGKGITMLSGPAIPRTNEDVRSGIPLSAANARAILADMERDCKSLKRRKAMALFFANNARNATPEAIAVYRAYAEKG